MKIQRYDDKNKLGEDAARNAGSILRSAIAERGRAVFIAATGASQFEFLQALTNEPGIDWSKTTMFHLDEYIGVDENHPASFRKYLRERLISKINPGTYHLIDGNAQDPEAEIDRLNSLIQKETADVLFCGIGENAHLAFNDPPANFETTQPYIVVALDEACRQQQYGEGWFPHLIDVPKQAISMSIREMMRAKKILCSVSDKRKAKAVQASVEGPLSTLSPASILREHPDCTLFLDHEAASLLKP